MNCYHTSEHAASQQDFTGFLVIFSANRPFKTDTKAEMLRKHSNQLQLIHNTDRVLFKSSESEVRMAHPEWVHQGIIFRLYLINR